MSKIIGILLFSLSSLLTVTLASAATPSIIGPDMEIVDNNIIVNLSIDNVAELEDTIRSGIKKEIVFTVELLRVWRFWADEYVVSKRITKVIKYDNLREQYLASTDNGIITVDNHFKDYNSMKDWIFTVNGVNLANIRELEPDSYYLRIVVESKSIEQLPVIGYMMHFIPEVEMTLAKESEPFVVEDRNEKP